MSIIPQFIIDAAVAADKANERALDEERQKIRQFENKVIGVCVGVLVGIWFVEIAIHYGSF